MNYTPELNITQYKPVSIPLISCLMVTQQGRLDETRQAIACFIRQNFQPIELIIVHDSNDACHQELLKLVNSYSGAVIHIYQEIPGNTLGWLRNRSLSHANAELVCQWDDDDYSHPERLKAQYNLMQKEGTDFCFMTDQLHLFTEQGFLFWDNWQSREEPYDLIENTMLGKRALLCDYPHLSVGEDTAIIEYIFTKQYKISRLKNMGWLYTYVYNGKNAWDFEHHSAISLHRRFNSTALLAQKEKLEEELRKYKFPFDEIYMPHDRGRIKFRF